MFTPAPIKATRCRALYISPLKALAVDVERNLRSPLDGIALVATLRGDSFHRPTVFVRTGDTPSAERAHFQRLPADILITTPESLYLMLTSKARAALRSIETVIVDEIHALVPTKRGAHLALSLERLEHLCGRHLQRIGLSATQRPLAEVAHFLAGVESFAESEPAKFTADADSGSTRSESSLRYRPVTVLDASSPKRLDLSVQVPVEDMSRIGEPSLPGSPRAQSIWTSIHPELLELVRVHQSTLIFVNSRRLAERISGALNDLAGETLVLAHHGSVAPAQRKEIEERLRGLLKGLVATSSLELGHRHGAIDLVVQIELRPRSPAGCSASAAPDISRCGQQRHHLPQVSCRPAGLCRRHTRHEPRPGGGIRYPRNPLDVLAQQVVASIAMEPMTTAELFDMLRRAAPFAALLANLSRACSTLLSGRYPANEFADLRPRITWDRTTHQLTPREVRTAHRARQRWHHSRSRTLRRLSRRCR